MKRTSFVLCSIGCFCIALLADIFDSSAAGREYFQQKVNTTLHVSLDDKNHLLSGKEEIEYINNSPDTLHLVYFHLWPNAYKDNSTALARQNRDQGRKNFIAAKSRERGWIDDLHFTVDGKESEFQLLQDTIDVGVLTLAKPLPPGQIIHISTPFRVKIPDASISRLGHDNQAYYITQWFPKPAVYDRSGWNYFPYLNQGEFYSEWGNYDVSITLPENYVTAATGVLQDAPEKAWMEQKAADTTHFNGNAEDLDFPPSSSVTKTLHYHADNVHDFAWFADKRFHVAKGEVVLPSGKKVDTWALFTNNKLQHWAHAIEYINESIVNYSKWVGEYPYPVATAVDGLNAEGQDMEYPMITLIGECPDLFTYEITIAHEVSHFWYYGILASNERRYAWMDEGLANFSETRTVKNKYAADDRRQYNQLGYWEIFDILCKTKKYNHRQAQDYLYRSGASINIDQPSNLYAQDYSLINYLGDIYYKPSVGFDYLQTVMGDSLFNGCMQVYFAEWKFRHPMPEDMHRSFEGTSGQNLDWFFNGWLATNEKIDYRITGVEKRDDGNYNLLLKSKGVPAPFFVSGYQSKKEIYKEKFNSSPESKQFLSLSCKTCDEFRIDADEQMPEVDRQNNTIRTNGLLKKTEPLRLRFLGGKETVGHTTIFFTPVFGFNQFDGEVGVAIYNLSLVEKPLEYLLMPMYAWNSKGLVGGRVMLNLHPTQGLFNRISLGPGISHYSFAAGAYATDLRPLAYTKAEFDIIGDFRKKSQEVEEREYLTLRNIFTETERVYWTCLNCDGPDSVTTDKRLFVFLNYARERKGIFNPSVLNISAGINKHFYRLSFEYKKTLSYFDQGRGFDFRFFAGKVGGAFHNEDDVYLDHRLHMSGLKGSDDYLYDGTFFTRESDPQSSQFINAEGGFAAPTNYGQANWIAAVNLKTIIHPILPVKLYFNFGTFEDAGTTTATTNKVLFEMGIEIYIIPDVITWYFPLKYSAEMKEEFKTNNLKFGDLTRFEFNLSKLNPFITLKEKTRNGRF